MLSVIVRLFLVHWTSTGHDRYTREVDAKPGRKAFRKRKESAEVVGSCSKGHSAVHHEHFNNASAIKSREIMYTYLIEKIYLSVA